MQKAKRKLKYQVKKAHLDKERLRSSLPKAHATEIPHIFEDSKIDPSTVRNGPSPPKCYHAEALMPSVRFPTLHCWPNSH